MKILQAFSIIAVFVFFSACKNDDSKSADRNLPSSSGKYGEVLVVIDSSYEKRQSGQAVEKIFYQAVEALPQQEPLFRMSTVDPDNFRSILKRSRNLLRLSIAPNHKTSIKVEEDVWAKDQLLIQVYAPNDEAAAELLLKNKEQIQDYFNEREKERLQAQFNIKPNKELSKLILDRFKASMVVPPGFVLMDTSGNGLWLKKEKQIGQHQVLQGIMIYEFPYTSDSTFSSLEMMNSRDLFTKTHIQGSRDSSFMAVYREYKSIPREVNLNGKYAVQYKGLWNMKNDFMGGPYLHYTLVDEKRNRVLHLDGFVYAPKFNKREYIRELDAIIQTFEILPKGEKN